MSAYYIFTAIGLYPQAGTTRYFIGSPSISSIQINLTNVFGLSQSSVLKINAYNNSDENVFIDRLFVNGQEYFSPFIEHDALVGGAHLEFYMSSNDISRLCLNK